MFGIHFNSGSPRPAGAPGVPPLPGVPPVAAPAPALAVKPPLPTPPASIARKRLNMFDKEHISATLAEISRGFGSSNNFFGGLSGAAVNVADRAAALNKAQMGTTEVGGPDSAFEIHTDENGVRTYKPIAGVQEYLAGREKAKNAPKPGDNQNFLGDTMYAIEQLPPEQRPGAYRLMLDQGHANGYDISEAPPEYSPTFSKAAIQRTIGARQGSANAATAANRAEINADRDATRAMSERFRTEASRRADAAAGRADESHRKAMRKAPPSTRNGDLDYLK